MAKKSLLRRAGVLAATLATSLLVSAQAAEPIKIGSFLSVTGPASFLGDPELKTLEMYVEKINEEGGVLGRPLELIHYDDVGNASNARNFAGRLIRSDRVDIIVGGSTTGATMAAVPLVEQARIPFISLAGAVTIVDPVKEWVFKVPQSDRMAAERILWDMRRRGFDKIGLISGTGGFGASGRQQTLAVASEYGIEVVADETYGPSDSDMTAQLTNIRNTDGVDAILNFGFGQGPAIVTKNYAALDINLPFYQSHGVASDAFLDLAGDAAEGLRLPASPILIPSSLPDDDPQREVVQSYAQEYRDHWGTRVSTFGGYAYDGLMLAVQAIEAAGSTDKAAVRDELENILGYVGVTGIFNMAPDDHNGLTPESFRILEVKDGDWMLVE
ncbi:amino acid/amide ABC transporter substrate-binding protein, HAAT family [Marinobacter segnicrescens]|uniref:Amino acid/amide ABC transporter substrate-binding protein, HAAT family n=1 Tax=Marinobacter segnicrescens TaxID=430453 RepID=A0A1I0G6A4_9GAMM|nr:ABC transporter substrate-binding protein [Marinobacter segnicrescens]SET65580.1 amino acid/amide ABC transporter substrate-binding protein, HAAT family [Marinobacter segnicrescens]